MNMTEIPSGFEAMGRPIPFARMSAAYDAVREMVPEISASDAMSLVGRVASRIERDDPYGAMREATGGPVPRHISSPQRSVTPAPGVRLDVIGGYRLLATLCAAPVAE